MPIIKQALGWTDCPEQYMFYLSVNPTKDEVGFYKVLPEAYDDEDASIIKLNTFKDFESIYTLDYSQSSIGMVGIGEKNGVVKLFNAIGNNFENIYSNNVLSKAVNDDASIKSDDPDGPNILEDQKLLVKSKFPRCVNALSFSSTRSLVAMGLDKNKNDYSLQIWDVNYQSSANEYVNNSFQFFLNETIISSQFINDTNLLVSSPKLLREIDLRLTAPVFQLPTSLGNEIKVNPFNANVFATYSENGTSSIWDRRKLNNKVLEQQDYAPSLQFDKAATFYNTTASNSAYDAINQAHSVNPQVGSNAKVFNHLSFRWSTVRSEEFSTLNSSSMIKRWRLGSVPSETDDYTFDSLFVNTVNTVDLPFDRVVTFDYIPRINNKTSFLCMRQSGTVYRCSVHDSTSKINFSSCNDLITADYDKLEMYELKVGTQFSNYGGEDKMTSALRHLSIKDRDLPETADESEFEQENQYNVTDEEFETNPRKRNSVTSKDSGTSSGSEFDGDYVMNMDPRLLLNNDISMIMRRRAVLQYGMEPIQTVELIDKIQYLQNNAHIRNTWRWLAIAKSSVDDGTMISTKLDIGYEGILGIWNGLAGLSKQNRCRTDEILTEQELIREMEAIIKLRSKSGFGSASVSQSNVLLKNSKKSVQRKLCMIISGWDLPASEIEEIYKRMMKRDQFEKAAGWAVFFGDVPKAVEILSSSKKERLKLIATAVAGYSAFQDMGDSNHTWREQCRKMATELDDPYLRAMFAYISDNDWWEILYDSAISLRERLGVALRFLSDKDLSKFLERAARNVISSGELEGLILTGVTPSGIDLLQSYVEKTSDVQTAALISVYGCPRYFPDERVEKWVSTYRDLLNSWEFFSIRSKFDILRTKMSRNSSGDITNKAAPRQLYIQCIKCKKNINSAEGDAKKLLKKKRKQKHHYNTSIGGSFYKEDEKPQQKYSCPHCGTSFPRCAICLLPLGITNLPIMVQGSAEVMHKNSATADDNDYESAMREKRRLKLNEWFSFCLTCNHGMHAGHAQEWFERHYVCPVPGCSCHCVYS